MKKLIVSAVMAGFAATAALAGPQSELSKPVVAYTPIIGKNADLLGLTPDQRANLQTWKATMPAKRQAVEAKAIELRAQLRQAINDGAPVEQRQALADQIGAVESQLVMMRSNCVDHWRSVLTPEQFAKVIELAAAQ
jgi:Spy/CpxP family protein refolding chaperone